jgi:hypothetical protein
VLSCFEGITSQGRVASSIIMDKLRGLYKQKRRVDSKGLAGTASLGEIDDSDSLSSGAIEDDYNYYEQQPVPEDEDCSSSSLDHDDKLLINRQVVIVKNMNEKKKKSVRFSPIDSVVYFGCLFDQSADIREALWYTNSELSHNKRIAKHFISCSRDSLFETDALALSTAFYTAHSLSRTSLDRLETSEFLCTDVPASSAQYDVTSSSSGSQETTRYLTRGLEDSLCPNVADARIALARESRLIVLELHGLDHDDMVAAEYQDLSRTSLILARLQGMADAQDAAVDDMLDNNHTSQQQPTQGQIVMSKSNHVVDKNVHLTNNINTNIIEV